MKLAKLRLKELQRQIAARVADDRKVVETRLAKARSLTPQDALGARRIFEGIVTLYGEKPWAAEYVQQARAGLAELDSPQTAAEK